MRGSFESLRKLVPLCLACLTACGLIGGGTDRAGSGMGGSIVVGLSQIGQLDPPRATGTSSLSILRTACDGLVGLDPGTGAPRRALAVGWSLAPGAEKLTISLRPNVTFHDGTPVTSEAVREAFSRVARPSTASPWVSLVEKVTGFDEVQSGASTHLRGIRPLDPLHLEIELTVPFSDLPTVLAHPALIPVSLRSLRDEPEGPRLPVCAGPYRIEAGLGASDFRLGRAAESPSRNTAYLRRGVGLSELILVRSFDSPEDAYQAFRAGQVDIAPVPDSRVAEAQAARVGLESAPTPDITYLALDTNKSETSNAKLRQSLSLAIDRLVIIDAAFGDMRQPAVRWLPESYGEPSDSRCTSYARRIADPDRARELLTEAGVDPGSLKLPLRFDGSSTSRLVAEAIQVQLKEILGISAEPEPLESEAFSASIAERPSAGIWILGTKIDLPLPDQFLGALFRTGSPQNILGFSDPEFDSRVDEARRATSTREIRRLYIRAESELCDQMPAIPLWTAISHWMINPQKVTIEGPRSIDQFGAPLLRHARAKG